MIDKDKLRAFSVFQFVNFGEPRFDILWRDGNYAVIVTEGTCFDTSNCIFVSKLGIDHNNHNQKLGIAPNPFNNTLSLKGMLETDKVILYDIYGKTINLKWENSGNELLANTAGLASGIYILRIVDAKGLVKYKQTIQHD